MRTLAKKQRLLIDFCGGIDQAVALLHALTSPEVQVAGIICSDHDRERGFFLAKKVVDWAKPGYEIPIVSGSSQPLLHSLRDGTGTTAEQQNAGVRLLVEKANEAEGELVVVTLGSLTTLAKAAAIDTGLPRKLKSVVVSGGAIRTPGDVTPVAERNVHADPGAAAFVLASGLPMVLVPLDATPHLRLTESQREEIMRLAKANGFFSPGQAEPISGSLHAWGVILAALHPEQAQIEQMKLSVDTKSDLSYGAVLADLRAKPSVGRDTAVCVHVEAPGKWLQTILEKVGNESR